MQQLHHRLPNLTALEEKASAVFLAHEAEVLAGLAAKRAPVILAGKRAFLFLVGIIASAFVSQFIDGTVAFLAVLVCSILFFVYARRWHKLYRAYVDTVSRSLARLIGEVIELPFTYIAAADHTIETEGFVNDSGLALERYDTVTVDDMYRCTLTGDVSFREIITTREEGDGKRRRTVTVFKGMFITAALSRRLTARTYISTESEKHKMEHATFWQKITGDTSAATETILEWNQFEKDLHVASTDPVEARYILTPNFMADLYDWWQENKENIRIGFKNDTMSMLLPDHKIAIGTAPLFGGSEALRKYFVAMVRPIWRTLTLVEDIKF